MHLSFIYAIVYIINALLKVAKYWDHEYKLIITSIIIFRIANLVYLRTLIVELRFLYLVCHFINFTTKLCLIIIHVVDICPENHSKIKSCQPIPDRAQREEDSLSARKFNNNLLLTPKIQRLYALSLGMDK